ncbi:MAG: hypothetical protein ACLFP6_10565, partial [Spirochaetaceae bacterium]
VANTSGVTVGESYTTTLLGQELSVAISSDGDNLVYRGDLPEDSGFLEFRYNTASDTFQYEHLIYVENYPKIGELIVWAKVEDGVVNPSDQTFRGVYELAYYMVDSETSTVDIGFNIGEIYRGVLGTPKNFDGTAGAPLGLGLGIAQAYGGALAETGDGGEGSEGAPVGGVDEDVFDGTFSATRISDGSYAEAFDNLSASTLYPMLLFKADDASSHVEYDFGEDGDDAPAKPTTYAEFVDYIPDTWEAATGLTEIP